MECTQRLESTQDLNESRSERVCPEQIGFLGICGVKHPVKQGPNKIGRDPQTCSIVLNLNSISRQHAVINVLNQKEFMLMDLDSANKTKLMNRVLPAYIPHPLKNGDMVQFGDIFGVFRLLEEDNELPMTQAIDMPDTPVSTRHMSKLNLGPVTTIPESPDVSDREESFIAPSQPKTEKCFQNSSSNHFIKPSSKVISIKPVGSSKLDNIFWNNSSKKSVSLNSQFDDSSLNDSTLSNNQTSEKESNNTSIYNMETQPADANDSFNSIYTASTRVVTALNSIHTTDTQIPGSAPSFDLGNTQITGSSIHTADTQITTKPTVDQSTLSNIHMADTQVPTSSSNDIHCAETQIQNASPSIHSVNTQLPPSASLPEVCKIDNQQEMHFNLFPSNKQNNNIFEADTQCIVPQNDESIIHAKSSEKSPAKDKMIDQITKKLNVSDEVILFDELDCQEFEDDFASQPLLPPEPMLEDNQNKSIQSDKNEPAVKKYIKKDVIIHSDSSTDCEDIDILPTQKITDTNDEEDLTDCEDLISDMPKKVRKPLVNEENLEDMLTQVIVPENNDKISIKTVDNINMVDDLPTQIIVSDDEVIVAEKESSPKTIGFEDMPTQVIRESAANTSADKDNSNKNIAFQDEISPFKIPLISPIKLKRKDIKVIIPKKFAIFNKTSPISITDDDKYYSSTQDILNDLCTQRESLPNTSTEEKKIIIDDDEFLPSSVEDYVVGKRFPHLDNLSPTKKLQAANKSSGSSDGEENVNNFVSKLSSQQIRDMVGVENQVDNLRRAPSDPSDIELTPKKVRPNFMDIDLPSSQEIKNSVSANNKIVTEDSSSESEMENDSEECTPILFRKKTKSKVDAKIDLTKVFDAEALPTRVLTRVRKPTYKIQNSDDIKTFTSKVLNPMYLTEQEDEIDKDIITENITRLKSKREKMKNKAVVKEVNEKGDYSKEKENAGATDKINSKTSIKSNQITEKDTLLKQRPIDINKEDTEKSTTKDKSVTIIKKFESNSRTNSKNISIDTNYPKEESKTVIVLENPSTSEKVISNVKVESSTTFRSTRNTRNKRKAETITETSSISKKNDSQNEPQDRTTRRQNNKKTKPIDLTQDPIDVRRSARPKVVTVVDKIVEKTDNVSEKIEKTKKPAAKAVKVVAEKTEKAKKPATRRGRPPKHEQSTVYGVSSDSSADSPRNAKRSATGDMRPPSPKRTRSAVNTNNTSLRSTPARVNKAHYVLFTAFPCEEVKAKLEKLGATVVSDVNECSVVLTMQVKRTFKLLCAVGLGRPIVGPSWVQACVDTNMLVDPWLYILKDEAAEKRFQFNLERTLTGKRNFLKDYTVSATPNVMPSAPEMKLIVQSSGGSWGEAGSSWACVSCSADRALWPALRRRGATLVCTEFILGGVLRQRADVAGNKLLH